MEIISFSESCDPHTLQISEPAALITILTNVVMEMEKSKWKKTQLSASVLLNAAINL